MKLGLFVRAATLSGAAVMMAGSASAATISFNTTAAGTVFNNTGTLVLNSSGGLAATLTFDPIPASPETVQVTGVPSNINYGIFKLVCPQCTATSGATFSAFTFSLIVTDVTDGATGRFTGTSAGGSVFAQSSTIGITWLPVQLGTGTSNALTGSFGQTFFRITPQTLIVAPNSGDNVGQTTLQGSVDAVPEPATLGMIGASLLGLGLMRRRIRRSN